MTKVKFSGVGIVAMDGSLGDRTITRNFYGYYAKEKGSGPAVTSPALASWRGVFSFVHAAYEALTDIERNEWISAARNPQSWGIDNLTVPRQRTGFHLFMHVNLSLVQFGGGITPVPLMPAAPSRLSNFIVTDSSAANLTIQVDTAFPPDVRLLYACTPQLNAGRMSYNQIYTFFQNDFGNFSPHQVAVSLVYPARFGVLTPGRKVFFQVVSISASGVRSMPLHCSALLT